MKISLYLLLALCSGWFVAERVTAAPAVAGLAQDVAAGEAATGWELASATAGDADGQTLPPLSALEAMQQDGQAWASAGARWTVEDGRLVAHPGTGHAVASYTVQPGGAGFYRITNSSVHRAEGDGRIELRVSVRRPGLADDRQPAPAVYTFLSGGEVFNFDSFVGYLDAGDTINVSVGPDGDPSGDATVIDFGIAPTTLIPVSTFGKDAGKAHSVRAPGGWSMSSGVSDTAAARRLAWDAAGNGIAVRNGQGHVQVSGGDTVASFRVPQSGYYALHDAWADSGSSGLEVRLYVGDKDQPCRTIPVSGKTSLNSDLGFLSQGEVVHIAFAGGESATFDATVVEWAPRRAPLRVRRGEDGLLDVYASDAPHTAIDIPKGRWIEVPATRDDATQAIRAAFEKAKSAGGETWVGVRLQKGATYVIGSDMNEGGFLFEMRDTGRIVLDGNGATLLITNPEFQRQTFTLLATNNGAHNIVFADLTVDATHRPYTTGVILDVNPKQGSTQTLTVRLEDGAPDVKEIIGDRNGSSAYTYDPNIPGRIGFGTWSHYPNSGDGIKPTDDPRVFTHTVTRTSNSVTVGNKWLIKNKEDGLVYLTTRGDSHDITLQGITGKASGGGMLRFWATSAINIIDSTFEPKDHFWISSSADGIHGRGREGVWIENTLIRGICEDIMNTYGRTLAIKPGSDVASDEILLGVYDSSVRRGGPFKDASEDDLRVGDTLVFFTPATGKVEGYAQVLARNGDRVKLSEVIPGLEAMNEPGSRTATMVYSIDSVGHFVVRDSKFMDSMRIGIYIKARAGTVWGNTIEGQSAPAVFAVNEPEWPEGPPATHLWVQGNTFSQNNYGFMSRNRDFIVVDPADVSVYTRKFRGQEPDTYNSFVARGQHANSHVKVIGNTFHDWRGMGVAVRNAKNVVIADNVFLPPIVDEQMRKMMSEDALLGRGGVGRFAGVFLDNVTGVRVFGNQFLGLPQVDLTVALDKAAEDVIASDNQSGAYNRRDLVVALPFTEWFGDTSRNAARDGQGKAVTLKGAQRRAGRLGAGLAFDGEKARATLAASAYDNGLTEAMSLALWLRADSIEGTQVIYSQGNQENGVVIAIDRGRLVGGLYKGGQGAWLDLGPAVQGLWQHVALAHDVKQKSLRGFVGGVETASATENVATDQRAIAGEGSFGGAGGPVRLDAERIVPAAQTGFAGMVDEFYLFGRALTEADAAALAMTRSSALSSTTTAAQ